MAGSRSAGRREQVSREDRQQRLIYLGAGVVLVAVLAIVAFGLVVAWYLPPREQVLTVGDQEFTARDVADRAYYLATAGSEAVLRDPAGEALESILREQVLLQAGPGVVGDVTDQDVRDSMAETFELGEEYDDESLDAQIEAYLANSPITRVRLDALVRAGIVEERLIEQFQETVPESGEQLYLVAARTANPGAAQELIERVRSGEDFAEVAVELEMVDAVQGPPVVGWYAPETLPTRLAELADLEQGDVSDAIDGPDGVSFEVFLVSERTTDEPYAEGVRTQLGSLAFTDWMDEQESSMQIERSLTSSDADWIRRQLEGDLRG